MPTNLIELFTDTFVQPEDVSSVQVLPAADRTQSITRITLKSGAVITTPPQPTATQKTTSASYVTTINEALNPTPEP